MFVNRVVLILNFKFIAKEYFGNAGRLQPKKKHRSDIDNDPA
jgi:hypothetical protein